MCGRFALYEHPLELAEHFALIGDLDFSPSWNIAPSTRVCSIVADANGYRRLFRMRWGLIPSWAKDRSIGNKLINARGETVAEKPSFRSAFKQSRCIIPASGFYEWRTDQGIKQPWFISLKSGNPIAFAGLWETWHPKEASITVQGAGGVITSCCIITTTANSIMRPIHDRMPVILDREQWDTWLSPNVNQTAKLMPLIRPYDPVLMQVWTVSRELNRVGLRDDAGLIEKVSG